MLKPVSVPGQIVGFAKEGILRPLLNDEIIKEYVEVLNRGKFSFVPSQILSTLDLIKENAVFVESAYSAECFADETDRIFYETCLSGLKHGKTYLITGNTRHYPVRNFVVTPRQMLEIIEPNENGYPPS